MTDDTFTEQMLRRFVAGKHLPTAQLAELEEHGFIRADNDDIHHITLAGVKFLNERTTR